VLAAPFGASFCDRQTVWARTVSIARQAADRCASMPLRMRRDGQLRQEG
jgi:hypothetical protein